MLYHKNLHNLRNRLGDYTMKKLPAFRRFFGISKTILENFQYGANMVNMVCNKRQPTTPIQNHVRGGYTPPYRGGVPPNMVWYPKEYGSTK